MNVTKVRPILGWGLIAAILSGCSSNDLSRDLAQKLLEDAIAKESPITLPLSQTKDSHLALYSRCKIGIENINNPRTKSIADGWEKDGLIAMRKKLLKNGDNAVVLVCVPTEKAKNGFVLSTEEHGDSYYYMIKVAERKVVETTGIKMDAAGSNALVKFTFKIVPNIAGKHALESNREDLKRKLTPEPQTGSASMARYDDGWRVESVTM